MVLPSNMEKHLHRRLGSRARPDDLEASFTSSVLESRHVPILTPPER